MGTAYWLFWEALLLILLAIDGTDAKLRIEKQKDLRMVKLLWNSDEVIPSSVALEHSANSSGVWKPIFINRFARRNGFSLFRRQDLCTNYAFRLKGSRRDGSLYSQEVSTDPDGPQITETMNPRLIDISLAGNEIKLVAEWDMSNFPGWTLSHVTPELTFLTLSCSIPGSTMETKVTGINRGEIILGTDMVDGIRQGKGGCLAAIFIPAVTVRCGKELDTFVTYKEGKSNVNHYFKVIDVNCETVRGIDCPPRAVPPYCSPALVRSVGLGNGKVFVAWKFPDANSQYPDIYPDQPPKTYEIKFGRIVDDGKPIIYQKIQDAQIKSIPSPKRFTILDQKFDCDAQYRVQVCAVFDLPTSSINWHPINSYLLSTKRSCRHRNPPNTSGLKKDQLAKYLNGLDLDPSEIEKIRGLASQ